MRSERWPTPLRAPATDNGSSEATDFKSKETSELYGEGLVIEELSLKPTNLEVVGDVAGQRILDMGCGDGSYSSIFAKAGAHVIAVDKSSTQIEMAQSKNVHENIAYVISDGTAIPLEDESVDTVFMNMVLINMVNKESIEKTFGESKRVLKKGGRLIFSIIHPINLVVTNKYDQTVGFDPKNYFTPGSSYKAEALTAGGKKIHFDDVHYSLTYLSKTLAECGFAIKTLTESKPVPEKEVYLPNYLVFECVSKEE